MYEIQQKTGSHWEPFPDGEFDDLALAVSEMEELERGLGWTGLRVVRQLTRDDGAIIGCEVLQ